MRILAIDTSTSMASVAISVDDKIIAESLFNVDRTLSARLIPEIMRVSDSAGIEIADIGLFAASTGPGSFTGVRGGVATIQGLALAVGKPCAGFSSLALLAMNFLLSPHPVCPLIDARKNEVYTGLYDCSSALPALLLNDTVSSLDAFLDRIAGVTTERVIFVGDGVVRYHGQIIERLGDQAIMAPFTLHAPRPAHGILLAQEAARSGRLLEPPQLLPVYLRASDAEITRKNRLL